MNGTGRILVRYSGTESLARVMIEGADGERIRAMADDLAGVIRRADRTLVTVRGIGVDLVKIPRMREVARPLGGALPAPGVHRAARSPTAGPAAIRCPHFAARFAAKEAGLKALGTGLRLGVKWRELEVRRERGEAPTLVLSGRTREIGLARGGRRMLLALTHDGDYALAQAMLVDDDAVVGADPAGSLACRSASPSSPGAQAGPSDVAAPPAPDRPRSVPGSPGSWWPRRTGDRDTSAAAIAAEIAQHTGFGLVVVARLASACAAPGPAARGRTRARRRGRPPAVSDRLRSSRIRCASTPITATAG